MQDISTECAVSVIVSTFSPAHRDDIIEIIQSMQTQSSQSFELIIIVDENRELFQEYCDYLEKAGTLNMRCLFNPDNKGLSYSRNIGIQNALGEIISYLDDDAVPDPDWVAQTIISFEDDGVGASTGDIIPLWEDPNDEWFPRELYWMISCSYSLTPTEFSETERGFGANMSFRKSVLDEIGSFREDLGIRPGKWVGGEDSEMFLRVRQSGNKVIYNPKSMVHHKIPHRRILLKSLLKRAYNQGNTIAKMGKSESYASGNKSTEYSYLGNLVKDFIPEKLREFNRIALYQLFVVTLVVLCTGLGYIQGNFSGNTGEKNTQ
ncbi:hypothetical protein AZH53_05495 [Methanomicrobiaceae archaeon CYW5]|uniref:glycosyltransferase family 2 protein n=1 Tax=Methanovulcanius yangii TaxID=1789227 RepID=UPI0029CA74AC|nr:glycosyltransferase [Methanovulcanius yangii]MBT8507866.1 hypothetical protein [Methanovulcanius yangii]